MTAHFFVVDGTYKNQMARKFRAQGRTLADLLQKDAANALVPAAALAALSRLAASLQPVRMQLEDLRQTGKLTRSVPELAFSFAHMHLNRMFRSRHHEQEAVAGELLRRAYA